MTVIAWRDPLCTTHKCPLPSDQTAKVLRRRQDYGSVRRTCIHNRVPGARLVLAAVTDTGKAPSADMRRERHRSTPTAQEATPAVDRSHCGALPCKSRPLCCAVLCCAVLCCAALCCQSVCVLVLLRAACVSARGGGSYVLLDSGYRVHWYSCWYYIRIQPLQATVLYSAPWTTKFCFRPNCTIQGRSRPKIRR